MRRVREGQVIPRHNIRPSTPRTVIVIGDGPDDEPMNLIEIQQNGQSLYLDTWRALDLIGYLTTWLDGRAADRRMKVK